MHTPIYSQVWNKSAALFLNFETIFTKYTLISTYTFISFQKHFQPTLLIAPTLLAFALPPPG